VRILLTRLSAIGDIVHAWPMAEAIQRSLPGASVHWVVEEPLLPLVAGHPAVAGTIPVATRRWRRSPLARATRREVRRAVAAIAEVAPDVALDPQGLVKSAAWAGAAHVSRRIGLARPHRRERAAGLFYTETVTPPPDVRHVVDVNLALLAALGLRPPYGAAPDAAFLRPGPVAGDGRLTDQPVALLPGAGSAGKLWEADRWAAVAAAVAAAGLRPLVVWGPGEESVARGVVERSGGAAALAPPTTITELCSLLAGGRAAAGGDTGPVHLAAALGTPTLAVHVATDPARNGPRGACVHVVTGAAPTSGAPGRAWTGRVRDVSADEVGAALLAMIESGR
jgi:heptosyltransferase-1